MTSRTRRTIGALIVLSLLGLGATNCTHKSPAEDRDTASTGEQSAHPGSDQNEQPTETNTSSHTTQEDEAAEPEAHPSLDRLMASVEFSHGSTREILHAGAASGLEVEFDAEHKDETKGISRHFSVEMTPTVDSTGKLLVVDGEITAHDQGLAAREQFENTVAPGEKFVLELDVEQTTYSFGIKFTPR